MGNATKSLSVEKEPCSDTIRWQRAGHCLLGVLLADFLHSGRIVNDGFYSANLKLPGGRKE
jgi:hypothetical protein